MWILTDVPIGAWTAGIVFDALDSMSPRRQYSIAADTAVALGLAGAVGAAATGLDVEVGECVNCNPPNESVLFTSSLITIDQLSALQGLIMRA